MSLDSCRRTELGPYAGRADRGLGWPTPCGLPDCKWSPSYAEYLDQLAAVDPIKLRAVTPLSSQPLPRTFTTISECPSPDRRGATRNRGETAGRGQLALEKA